ncbi:MAG TPA: hypothetical protein DCG85_03650 [Lachnospiraceae bacterium]|nr:hypothetical protein [Lachnospiraceae bacterium]
MAGAGFAPAGRLLKPALNALFAGAGAGIGPGAYGSAGLGGIDIAGFGPTGAGSAGRGGIAIAGFTPA